jgi:hypothetical protein
VQEIFETIAARDDHRGGRSGCLDRSTEFLAQRRRRMEHLVVSREEWLAARKALLAKEEAWTRLRDKLSEERPGAASPVIKYCM